VTSRRRFLSQSAAVAAGWWWFLPGLSHDAASGPAVKFPLEPRGRIAVSSYSFREFIVGTESKSGNRSIELKDFAAHVIQKFNVNKIEPWSRHFPSTDPKYLEEFRHSVNTAGAAVANLAVDGSDSLYASGRDECEKATYFSKKWIDIAVALGSPSIRTNISRARDAAPEVARLAANLRPIAEHASARNVVVHLENDDPLSEDPFFLVKVIKKVNSPWLRSLPDFGNTLSAHDDDYAYEAIDEMFAHAYGICHVKDGSVDEQGKATHVDLARTFGILKRHSYKGFCSIEYDAPGDPYKPTAALIDTTVEHLS
jgi:sugar phosphate isomerase/epimerase